MEGRSTVASRIVLKSELDIGNIDLSRTLTPEEKYEIITRNLQVWIYYFNLCMQEVDGTEELKEILKTRDLKVNCCFTI